VHDAVRSPAAPAALALLGGALASADGVVVAVIDTRAEAEAVARDEGVEVEGLGREDDRRRKSCRPRSLPRSSRCSRRQTGMGASRGARRSRRRWPGPGLSP
jgi:hypothetical protein